MDFGSLLSEERRLRGWSQQFTAGLANTTQRHLSFLETGRSRPTREMVLRLGEALDLSPARRAALFEAAGFVSPYRQRGFTDTEISAVLRIIETQVIANWPFGAFALTPRWDVLLTNAPGAIMLGTTPEAVKTEPVNFFDVILSPSFRERVRNWDECAAAIYARMRRHSATHPGFQPKLEHALAAGLLARDFDSLAERREIPAILPFEIVMPDGSVQRISSLSAHFTSVHDEFISGIEIELLVPL